MTARSSIAVRSTVPTDPGAPHVVVIGAGIIGATLAYALLRRGAQVTVIDCEGPGSGTTGTSFAWIHNQSYFRNLDPLSDDLVRRYFSLHRMGILAWRQLTAEIGARLGIVWKGTVQFGQRGSSDAKLLREDLHRRQRWGSPSFPISPAQVRALVPGIEVGHDIEAFTTLDEGHLDPTACCAVLMNEIRALGANVVYNCEATGVDITDDRVEAVETTQGPIRCDHLVCAVGVNSPELLADLGINAPIERSQGALVHLQPMKPLFDPVLITPDLHISQRFDGHIVLASGYSGTPISDAEALDADILLTRAKALLPELGCATIERVTIGERVVPHDGLPIIGSATRARNAHSITTNSGITLGPILGNLMATELLTGITSELLDPYRATRFA
ncbi:NAD(P)/FAD-dependent oxidoreductase [Nocardia sp. NPDC004711]